MTGIDPLNDEQRNRLACLDSVHRMGWDSPSVDDVVGLAQWVQTGAVPADWLHRYCSSSEPPSPQPRISLDFGNGAGRDAPGVSTAGGLTATGGMNAHQVGDQLVDAVVEVTRGARRWDGRR